MKQIKSIISATALFGTIGAANAASIMVGTVIGIDVGTSGTAGNFNEVAAAGGSVTAGTMIDTSGVIVDSVDLISNPSFANSDTNIGAADANVTALGFDSTHQNDFGGRATDVFFVFRNLDPSLLYNLEVVSAFDGASLGTGGTSIFINGSATASGNIITNSASPFAVINNIATTNAVNEPNSINIRVNAPGSTAVVNALRLTAVPEPSSTALLGLGGLAMILRRRK